MAITSGRISFNCAARAWLHFEWRDSLIDAPWEDNMFDQIAGCLFSPEIKLIVTCDLQTDDIDLRVLQRCAGSAQDVRDGRAPKWGQWIATVTGLILVGTGSIRIRPVARFDSNAWRWLHEFLSITL